MGRRWPRTHARARCGVWCAGRSDAEGPRPGPRATRLSSGTAGSAWCAAQHDAEGRAGQDGCLACPRLPAQVQAAGRVGRSRERGHKNGARRVQRPAVSPRGRLAPIAIPCPAGADAPQRRRARRRSGARRGAPGPRLPAPPRTRAHRGRHANGAKAAPHTHTHAHGRKGWCTPAGHSLRAAAHGALFRRGMGRGGAHPAAPPRQLFWRELSTVV